MSNIDLNALLKSRSILPAELARMTGVNRATVTRWVQRRVPLERVYQVEEKTGISRHELRPDFFGDKAGRMKR